MDEERLRILLVEDDRVDRMAVQRALRAAGLSAEVVEAGDVAAALEALRGGFFDCVLLDYQLPGGDGTRVLRDARAEGIAAPVVMLTGQADTRTAVELMKEGASDYLDKAGLTPERLERSIRHAVRVHRAEMQAGRAQAALREEEERYRLVTRATNDIIWDWDLGTGEILWNEALGRVMGYAATPLRTPVEWWYEQVHPDDRERVVGGIRAVIDGSGEVWSDEYRFRRADGGWAEVRDRGYVSRDPEGRPTRMIGSMEDFTDQRRAERALREAEERVRLATESAEVGTWDFNPATGELRWSERCKAAFGLPPDAEVDYATFLARVHPEDRERADEAVRRSLDPGSGGEYDVEYRSLWPDGTVRWIVAKGRAFFDGEGPTRRAVRFIGTVLDITGRKRAEEERERALHARDRFYAAMSHELRTPINAVLGYNDLLLAGIYGPLNAQQEQGLERGQRAARHLLELVNDVLDLSKLEAGKTEIQAEEVDVAELVEELFVTVRPLAAESGSDLRSTCGPGVSRIRTDPRRVRQILLNLLSNAIKFGEGHPIEVRCARAPLGGVVLEVVDRGRGIAAADVDRIFDEFVQLPGGSTGGTGLGLAISQRLARLLGGSLEVDSEPGAGSTFRLRLPADSPEGVGHAGPPRDDAAVA
ncbi:MAG TPA: PAS domain-containing protein [Longimicrobiaceae bacterium]|nr:PAS domain-containing protein [Longimicrobiaceae bacterium]